MKIIWGIRRADSWYHYDPEDVYGSEWLHCMFNDDGLIDIALFDGKDEWVFYV